jgi:hypothetical protein
MLLCLQGYLVVCKDYSLQVWDNELHHCLTLRTDNCMPAVPHCMPLTGAPVVLGMQPGDDAHPASPRDTGDDALRSPAAEFVLQAGRVDSRPFSAGWSTARPDSRPMRASMAAASVMQVEGVVSPLGFSIGDALVSPVAMQAAALVLEGMHEAERGAPPPQRRAARGAAARRLHSHDAAHASEVMPALGPAAHPELMAAVRDRFVAV